MHLKSGRILDNKYELGEKLGEGGFGVVFKARQLSTQRVVAVKFLKPSELLLADPAYRTLLIARFQREMRLVARLEHPHIVTLLDMGGSPEPSSEVPLYAVFPFIDGITLADYLLVTGGLSVYEARRIMLQVLEALAHAHTKKIVHRDIKPDNIILTGAVQKYAHVLDFGIAGIKEEGSGSLTGHGEILGTPAYMAPEQIKDIKSAGPPADLYAWGLVYLETLTGVRVARGDTKWEVLSFHANADPIQIPEDFLTLPDFQWVFWALNKNPDHRPSDANALLSHISAFLLLATESTRGEADQPPAKGKKPPLRRTVLRRLLAGAITTCIRLLGWLSAMGKQYTAWLVFILAAFLLWLYFVWALGNPPLRFSLNTPPAKISNPPTVPRENRHDR